MFTIKMNTEFYMRIAKKGCCTAWNVANENHTHTHTEATEIKTISEYQEVVKSNVDLSKSQRHTHAYKNHVRWTNIDIYADDIRKLNM